MNTAFDAVDKAILEIEQLQKGLGKIKTTQVSSKNFRLNVKSVVRAWFDNWRKSLQSQVNQDYLRPIDAFYQKLLQQCGGRSLKSKYKNVLSDLRKSLISLRSGYCLLNSVDDRSNDLAPDFSVLIHDQEMRDILCRRWAECSFCIKSKQAPLSAVVMMGGMMEGLMLARVLRDEANKAKIFGAKSAPKDKSGKLLNLKEWTLNNYLDVAHEINWISQTAKDVSVILRDYRNYIHPHKEYTEKIKLSPDDAIILWEVCKSISRQILSFNT